MYCFYIIYFINENLKQSALYFVLVDLFVTVFCPSALLQRALESNTLVYLK